MISDYAIQKKIQIVESVSNHEEELYKILEVFMEIFPVLESKLFRYSSIGYLAEGVNALSPSGLIHIRELREDVRSLPIVYSAIHERKAKFYTGIEFLKNMSSKYKYNSTTSSQLVVPITYGTVVIGFISSIQFPKWTTFNGEELASITLYGKLVGETLMRTIGNASTELLSKRELEVMKKISWGDGTKEMAEAMDISEYTVKQYVKSAIKKLDTNNRAHTVAKLMRMGVLE
ncbi:LuxR C-terminal-related transcriptional regulator [Bacillaceae bacterium S4-13-56]